MKGTISPLAAKILRDPIAKDQLDSVINSGKAGTVTLDGKIYNVQRSSVPSSMTDRQSNTNESEK